MEICFVYFCVVLYHFTLCKSFLCYFFGIFWSNSKEESFSLSYVIRESEKERDKREREWIERLRERELEIESDIWRYIYKERGEKVRERSRMSLSYFLCKCFDFLRVFTILFCHFEKEIPYFFANRWKANT